MIAAHRDTATLGSTLRDARSQLITTLALEMDVAALEVYVLLGYVLNKPRAYLLAHPEALLSRVDHAHFSSLVTRRLQGEPIAYLVGQREFYGLIFAVTPDVLIPRPETELLVELALERMPPDQPLRVLDLGTGSGAIAVTLAKHRPQAQITALDLSPRALDIARANAARHQTCHITFIESHWFSALPPHTSRFDLIVANPPYVADNDPHFLCPDIRFEPAVALRAGPEGLDAIRHIARFSGHYLNVNGHLLLEHGYNQQGACAAILSSQKFSAVTCYRDIGKQARVSLGKKEWD